MADRWYEASYDGTATEGKKLKLHVYTISTNIVENATLERADLYISVTNTYGSFWNNYGSSAHIGINGHDTTVQVGFDARTTGDKVLITSWDTTVYHDNDGTKTIGVSAYHNTGTALGNASMVYDYVCDRIPRQANITNAIDFNDEQNPSLTFNNAGGFPLNLRLEFSGTSIIRNGIPNTGSYTVVLTDDERNLLRSKASNVNDIQVNYVLATILNGIETWTSTYYRRMYITNANPIFNNFTYADTNSITKALTGNDKNIIHNYSNIKATVSAQNKAIAQKMASMNKYRLQIGNKMVDAWYSSTQDVSMTINKVDSANMRVYAIDSRGNSTVKELTPNQYINYSDIKITNSSVSRENNVGSTTKLNFSGTFWNDSFGVKTNTVKSVSYQYKKTTSSTWTTGTTALNLSIDNNNFSFNGNIAGDLNANGFDASYSYDIRVTVKDELSTFSTDLILGSGTPALAISQKGVALGQPYDDSEGGRIQGHYEVGDLFLTFNNKNPGERFGGTWELVAKGCTLIGVDPNQAEFNVVKKSGGSKTVTLNINNIPSHSHEVKVAIDGGSDAGNRDRLMLNGWGASRWWSGTTQTTSTGSGQAFSIIPPYITCYIWTKTA